MKNIFDKLKKGFGISNDQVVTEGVAEAPVAKPVVLSSSLPAAAAKREDITRFIMHSLKPYMDEKMLTLSGLRLYLRCRDKQEEELARVALYIDKPSAFQQTYLERKLMDHFIPMADKWFLDIHVVRDEFPAGLITENDYGLEIVRNSQALVPSYSMATIKTLKGQTTKPEYLLDPANQLKFHIGRTSNPQLASGKIQINDIVFTGKDDPSFNEETGKANLQVSRNHAIIMYKPQYDKYFLYPDKGGLPENGNKIKIHTADDKVKWLNIQGVSHELQHGDQVELGGEAILLFEMK